MLAKSAVICGVLAVIAGYMGVDAIAGNQLVWHEGALYATEGYDPNEAWFGWAGLIFWWAVSGVLLLVSIVTSLVQARRHRKSRGFFIAFAVLVPVFTAAVTALAWTLKLALGDATPIPLE